ncbi:MAG TPA: VanZ family protein [Gemmatimonadaceae bacterium]|nr:VanZ family protein [Gemmatimonadaceae bacterium]
MPQRRFFAFVFTWFGLALVVISTLLPVPAPARQPSALCITCGGAVDLILNVLLFVPLGLGLGLRGTRQGRAMAVLALLPFVIEVLQATVIGGRHASVRDLVTNTLGGWAGFWLAVRHDAWTWPAPRRALALATGWSAAWLLTQALSAVAVRPDVPPSRYYGQLRRAMSGESELPSLLIGAHIAELPLLDVAMPDSALVRERLRRRPLAVTAEVLPSQAPPYSAPILRVVDRQRRELLGLSQSARDLRAGARTVAARVRFRPLRFVLPEAFPPASTGTGWSRDTLRIEAVFATDAVTLRSRWRGEVREEEIAYSASWGWALVFPMQTWQGSGFARTLTMLWLVGWMVPVGYWLASARRGGASARLAVGGLMALPLLGLAAVPLVAGLRPSGAAEWIAAVVGLVAGWLAAYRAAAHRARQGAAVSTTWVEARPA